MTFKFEKRTLFTALLAFAAVICTVLAISLLIPTSRTLTASADDSSSHGSHSGWTALSTSTTTLESGKYYLSSNLSVNITISGGGVTLCLNGKALTPSTTGSAVIKVTNGASLTLCDCQDSGTISGTTKSSSNSWGAGVFVNSGTTFTMEGGTITGNSAGYGGGVYVEGTFIMNGGTISKNKATAGSGYSSNGGAGVYVKDGTFTMNGGTITGNTSTYTGGGVYLSGSSSTFNMTGGTISSNTASGTSGGLGGGVYVSGGTFNMSGGTISSNTTKANGGGVYMSGGTFNMSGGSISSNSASGTTNASGHTGGGVTLINGATFTMSGGTISNNKLTKSSTTYTSSRGGGGVCVLSGCTFTMTGGTISSNTVTAHLSGVGGGVYVAGTFNMSGGTISSNRGFAGGGVYVQDGTFTMTGGTISSNTAKISINTVNDSNSSGKCGGGVCVKSGTFNMSGGTITGNTASSSGNGVYVYSSATITGGYLDGEVVKGDSATLSMTGGYLSSTAYGSTSSYITSSGYSVAETNDSTYVYAVVKSSPHTCNGQTFTKVLALGGTLTEGKYFLAGNVDLGTLSADITISSGTVYLCLNGYTLTGTGNGSVITVSGGELILCDCGEGKITGGSAENGGGVYVNGVSFTMSGGTITANTASTYGGGVYVKSGTFNMTGGTISSNTAKCGAGVYVGGTFTISNGTITKNTATSGGGVHVDSNGTFNMTGGTISSNTASNGGGVYVDRNSSSNGTFNMTGGTISSNTASSSGKGGGVLVYGTFTMSNGTISGNTASTYGGGVYVYQGTFTMSGGKISGNTASSEGGGVHVGNNGSKFTMTGGEITSNTSSINGGGVYVGGTFNMKGGTISGNSARYGAGVHVCGTFTMSGGSEISKNTASNSGYGGGVNVSDKGTFTMSNGTISGNSAYYGGGVRLYGGTFTMEDGTISDNTANYFGGINVSDGSTFEMKGGTISGNKSTTGEGGGVRVYKSAFTMTGGTISGNTAATNGDGVYVGDSSSTFNMAGGNLNDSVYISGGDVDISGGYFSDSAYESIKSYIDGDSVGVSLTDFASVYSSRSKRSATEEYTYAVYSDGNYDIAEIDTTYGEGYEVKVDNACGEVYILYTWGEETNGLTLPSNVGEYNVLATIITVDGETVCAGIVEFTIIIAPKSLTSSMFCVNTEGFTYTGTAQNAGYDCKEEGLTYGSDYIVVYGDNINAGEATITFIGKGNYTGTVCITYEIAKATVEVTLCGETETTYNGSAHSLTVSGLPADGVDVVITYCLVGEDGTTYALTNAPVNAGTYTVTAEFTSANYDISTVSATLTIKKADYNMSGISLSGSTVTYDGSAHSLAISGELSDGITVTYYYVSEDGTTTTEAPINAGTYTVTAVFTSDNYSLSDLTATLTIKKATLSVEAITGVTAKVGDRLEDIELPEGWSWSDSATLDEVGEFGFEAIYSAGDNYETVTTTITVSVIGTGLSDGEIAGIVIAGAAFVILVAVLVIFVLKRKEEAVV